MIRVAVIEDQDLYRLGIKTAIAQSPDMELCGEACCGEDGLKLVEQTHPDIVLVDIGLPDINGLKVTSLIKQTTSCKVIVLTCHSAQEVINSAYQCGADSYLLKSTDLGSIKNAIYSIYQNHEYVDQTIIKRYFELNSQALKVKGKRYKDLPTPTELEILKLIARGYSNKEIADKLFVTVSTVKSHTGNLFSKLGARDRVNAIIKAQSLGYLEASSEVGRVS